MQSCCFIGHKNCPSVIKENLLHTIEDLILFNNITRFYVGTQGSFDRFVYDVLCELENKYEIQIIVVLAYLNNKQSDRYYDENKTIFPDVLTKVPMRFAIRRRNTYMIDKSDYMVCYLNT